MKRKISAIILSLCLILCTMAGMTTTVAGDHEHTLTYYPRVESTCIEAGHIAVWYCETCATHYTDAAGTSTITAYNMLLPLDPDNHEAEPTITASVPATCTENGSYTYYYSCCYATNPVYYTETVYATGHTPDGEGTVTRAATCTEAGEITYTCSVCSETYTESIPATGNHTAGEAVVEDNVPATCTTDGSYDSVVYCVDCNEELSRETVTVPATGHSYEATVTAPTCTEGGYTTYTCTVCGYTYTADETAALGHSYEAVVTEPTCTEGGYTTYTCSVCRNSYVADETAATGHTEVTDEAVAATCTETGLTEGSHCSVCNEIIVAQEVVEATGHAYGISCFTWADNYRSATATFACANCSDEQTVNATVTVENYYGMYVYVATARYGASGATYSSVKTVGTVDMSGFETNSTEEVETEEPVEGADTETEADEESEPIETPIETNPTTGMVLALLPMAIAMAGAVAGKKRLG